VSIGDECPRIIEASFAVFDRVVTCSRKWVPVVQFLPLRARGAHQLYDLHRTLGSAYVLAKYLYLRYRVHPISSVTFVFTLVGDQNPDTLPKPTYQGWYEMDVSRDSLSQCATDAVVSCLRAGANPRETRASVANDLDDFWMREFSSIRIV
jgi:hypothetical protein